jgi:hypothetical protein
MPDLTGTFTDYYLSKTRDLFKAIENISYYIHDEVSLLDSATSTYSWSHWDGHEKFISKVFSDIDQSIDLDFTRTYNSNDAHIEIYRVSPDSPFAQEGILGIAIDSHTVEKEFSLKSNSKSFGDYWFVFWSGNDAQSPFIKDYDLLQYSDAHTIIHEIGHSLGLSHPQADGLDDPTGVWHNDEDTIMSYNWQPRYDEFGIFSNPPLWSDADRKALIEIWGEENGPKTVSTNVIPGQESSGSGGQAPGSGNAGGSAQVPISIQEIDPITRQAVLQASPLKSVESVVIMETAVTPNSTEADRITGFNRRTDVVALSQEVVDQQRIVFASAKNQKAFNKQLKGSSNLIYNQRTGELVYDSNGRAPGLGDTGGVLAVFEERPGLGKNNFVLLAPDVFG